LIFKCLKPVHHRRSPLLAFSMPEHAHSIQPKQSDHSRASLAQSLTVRPL
jgi:hypothetical protein